MLKRIIAPIVISIIGTVLIVSLFFMSMGDRTETKRIPVGIKVNEEGYYSLLADVEFAYYDGEISEIYLDNPTLLAFKVSEYWQGGAMVYDYDTIRAIIDVLRAEGLDDLADELENGLLLTEAAT